MPPTAPSSTMVINNPGQTTLIFASTNFPPGATTVTSANIIQVVNDVNFRLAIIQGTINVTLNNVVLSSDGITSQVEDLLDGIASGQIVVP
jgi:hypothetical protein